jgi:esterase/lipase superfamily enzyme
MKQGKSGTLPRAVEFDLNNSTAQQSLHFCDRSDTTTAMDEVGSDAVFNNLRISGYQQLLFYIHGFNVAPEAAINGAKRLQSLLDSRKSGAYGVIPIIWASEVSPVNMGERYITDQVTSDSSGVAFARLLMMFLDWQTRPETTMQGYEPCTVRLNLLAHSMGNRVLRQAYLDLKKHYNIPQLPMIFRNIFLVAADLPNQILERGQEGELIPYSTRNCCVYSAMDDLALRGSKVINVGRNAPGDRDIAGRRLGHTGTENLSQTPKNVYDLDCSEFSMLFDKLGHGYFTDNSNIKKPTDPLVISPAFDHMYRCMETGRPPLRNSNRATVLPV